MKKVLKIAEKLGIWVLKAAVVVWELPVVKTLIRTKVGKAGIIGAIGLAVWDAYASGRLG